MKKDNKKILYTSICMLVTFIIWTILVKLIDVKQIGPNDSCVGFATLNKYIHTITGVNFALYEATDLLSIVPIGFVIGFGMLGLIQLIKRKNIFKVDCDILVLGVFYAIVLFLFAFFEIVIVNYRPILIEGVLEASYPSSTTLLVMCVMPTCIMQLNSRIKNKIFKNTVNAALIIFIIFMVVARLISGVHWFSDIIGGILLSTGLVMLYCYFIRRISKKHFN